VYAKRERGASGIYVAASDGTGQVRLTERGDTWPTWSPDGRKIAFVRRDDVWVMRSDGSGASNVTRTPRLVERAPDWQPRPRRAEPR
jgi:Tol biopolymer transport system component